MNEELKSLITEVVARWSELKEVHKPEPLWWNNPNLIWVYVSDNEEDYEGSQEQVGLDKDGVLRWEFQSHCSCNYYEDTDGLPVEFPLAQSMVEVTKKSFRLNDIPEDWESIVKENLKKILGK